MTRFMDKYMEYGYNVGRKEVAREIFAEIEGLKWIPFESEHYVVGYDDIAELKKKYTASGMQMVSFQLGSDDMKDGKTTKLPREKGGE